MHPLLTAALLLLPLIAACAQSAPRTPELESRWSGRDFYSLDASALEGKPLELAQYRGKVALVVNVASECGFTPQYEGLEQLWKARREQGLVVIGVPSNDFGAQEPGDAQQIRSFCTQRFGVSFPLAAKAQTKAGPGQSPLYEYLGTKTGKLPGWNFCKYLIGRDGQPIAFYASTVAPDDAELLRAIDAALAAKPL